jgi:hypothetical protein
MLNLILSVLLFFFNDYQNLEKCYHHRNKLRFAENRISKLTIGTYEFNNTFLFCYPSNQQVKKVSCKKCTV